MKPSKATLAVVVLSVAAAGCADGSGAARSGTANEKWACAPDHIATSVYELAADGGYETTDAALQDTAKVLASDGVADQEALADAAEASGESGRLVIEGEIVADVAFAQLDDGTWTVASVQYCSPPPGDGGT